MPFIVACALFLFLGGEETRDRKAARGDASPQGGKRRRESARRQEETQVRQAARGDASPSGGKRRRKSARRKGETQPR